MAARQFVARDTWRAGAAAVRRASGRGSGGGRGWPGPPSGDHRAAGRAAACGGERGEEIRDLAEERGLTRDRADRAARARRRSGAAGRTRPVAVAPEEIEPRAVRRRLGRGRSSARRARARPARAPPGRAPPRARSCRCPPRRRSARGCPARRGRRRAARAGWRVRAPARQGGTPPGRTHTCDTLCRMNG